MSILPLRLKVKYLKGSPLLEQTKVGDWIDLYTYEDVTLKKGEYAQVNLGVAIKLPKGYEALIAPRSSTFKRYGLLQANSIGVVDNSYCGNDDIWKMPVYATENITIPRGTRLCQFRILENQPKLELDIVESLGDDNRGGFGSTGA